MIQKNPKCLVRKETAQRELHVEMTSKLSLKQHNDLMSTEYRR